MNQPQELKITARHGQFAALHWSRPGAPRLLCLHGWLDNANSFMPLAPLLGERDIVALDFAGHGHSSHRPPACNYYFSEFLFDLDAVLDELAWEQADLLGHSLGGVVASAYAVALPGRVSRLALLDGVGAPVTPAEGTAERLHRSLKSVRERTGVLRKFDDLDVAIRARQAVSGFSEQAARLICTRSVRQQEGHLSWRTDPRLNWTSPLQMTEEQMQNLLSAVQCPTLSLSASESYSWLPSGTAEARHAVMQNCRVAVIEGHHHFHMDAPQAVASHVNSFLQEPGAVS